MNLWPSTKINFHQGILLLTFALTQLWPNLCQCAVRGLLACYRPLARILRMPMPSITMEYGPWTWYGTACVIGKFCQMTFPTMANVGLSPMMCYSHPGQNQRGALVLTLLIFAAMFVRISSQNPSFAHKSAC